MSSTPRALSQAGVALLAVYIVILLGALWPIQLIQPEFQLKIGSQLINSAPIALIGLAMIHLAATLDAGDPVLRERRRRAAALAVVAVLGFLLLIPLLSVASWRQLHAQARLQRSELRRAESQLKAFRRVLADSKSPAELDRRFQALQGPRLDASDRSQPMPLLRSRVGNLLDQLSTQLERKRNQLPALAPPRKLPEILRTALGALALAGGFAALARRPGVDVSLLDEYWLAWERLSKRLNWQRNNPGAGPGSVMNSQIDYLHQISGKQDDTPEA